MAQAARATLEAGVPAVVDGAFLKRVERDRFRALARELDARFTLVSCEASADVLRTRVEARHRAGGDASEADVHVLERQIGWQERPAADEEANCVQIDTQAEWAALEERVGALAEALTRGHR
jgi:predicted kinase